MSRRTLSLLSLQQRQLAEQRRLLRCIVEVSREPPERQNQPTRPERCIDQQRHASNQ